MIKFNKKIKNISILGLFLISSLFLTSIKIENDTTFLYQEISKRDTLNSSGFWSNFTYIHVKNNWTDFPVIDGEGSWSKPYTIENMSIDATTSPTGSGILIEDSKDVYFKIKNCTISNWGLTNEDGGIKLLNSSNGIIENNTCSSSSYSGIVLMGNIANTKSSNNNTIIGNTVNNNGNRGIFLEYYCANNTIVDNDINGNTAYGIDLWQFCSNNLITNNDISGNGRGINVQELSNMNTMEYNRLEKNGFGIYLIDNCDDNDLINNTIFDSTANGIYLVTNYELNLIVRNYLVTNGWNGIELDSCDYNTLADNIINTNGENGIELAQLCDFNNIKNNTLRSNGDAYPEGGIIAWNNCHNNNFTLNVIESNWYIGIHIGLSDGNLFNNNTIKNHEVGLRFYSSCDSNVIVKNSISQCSGANPVGLVIEFNCVDNIIQNNFINETFTGIIINSNADNTDITENIITNCDTRGILIQIDTCDNSEIWQNRFFNNVGENARDDSGTGDTSWDKGGIGNYWDDYGGVDANDNGIGDTPYDISGTGGNQDNFPIWDDGDDLYPTIIRNSPSPPFTFGANAPTFNLTIYDLNLHMACYKLNNTYTHFFTPVNGINIIQINQTSWDALAEGNFSIGFFVNDTSGNLLTMGMTVTKELPPDGPPSTPEIPFGNYFIVYGIIAIVTVVILKKRKINLK